MELSDTRWTSGVQTCVLLSVLAGLGTLGWQPAAEAQGHGGVLLRLSRLKLAGPPTPRDTEASNASAIIHNWLGPVGMCSLIGINSIHRPMPPLRRRMLEDMQIRHYSPHTIDGYLRYMAQVAKHFGIS